MVMEPGGREFFVGRRNEIDAILAAADNARAGRPFLVTVEGRAGIGKSMLLAHAMDDLDDFTVLDAAADEQETSIPYGLLSQLTSRLSDDVVAAHPMLGSPIDVTLRPGPLGIELLAATRELVSCRPVALVLDDIQWTDPESVVALNYVARRLRSGRLLVVAAVQTGEGAPGSSRTSANDQVSRLVRWKPLLKAFSETKRISLAGLSEAELADLARAEFRADIPSEMLAQLHDYTGGSPFLAKELLLEAQINDIDLGMPGAASAAFPGIVSDRSAGLSVAGRSYLDALAVLNRRCSLGLPAQIAGVGDPLAAVEELLGTGLIRWWLADSAGQVEIRHALAREVVYGSLSPRRRAELHLNAAPLVDGVASWRHRVAAAAGVDPELAAELEAVAENRVAHGDVEQASTYLLWAAELSPTRGERERRLLTAVLHLVWAGSQARAEQLELEAERCARSSLRTCALGEFAFARGDLATAQRLLSEVVAASDDEAGLAWLGGRARASLAAVFAARGRGELAVQHAEVALASHPLDTGLCQVCYSALVRGHLYASGPQSALEYLDTAVDRGVDNLDRHPVLQAWRGICRLHTGELVLALRDAVAYVSASTGRKFGDENPYTTMAFAQYQLGTWDAAMDSVERALASGADQLPWTSMVTHAAGTVVAAGLGDRQLAGHHLAIMKNRVRSAPEDCCVYVALGEASLAQADGDYAAMAAAFDPVEHFISRNGRTGRVLVWETWWLPLRLEALIGAEQFEKASEARNRLVLIADRVPCLRTVTGWLGGWLTERRTGWQDARESYERTLGLCDGSDLVPTLHRAQLEQAYGRMLYRAHSRRSAINWLRRAHRHYVHLGARPFVDRCAAELARYGLRQPASVAATDLLTEREREVVDLVGSGMSNQEVAARLYVSRKTVEYHLGNVYAKLGIRSRGELRSRHLR